MHRSIQQRKPVIEPAIFWDQRYYIFCIIRMIFHQPLQADAECVALSHAISADVPQIKQPFHGKKRIFIIGLCKQFNNSLFRPVPHTAYRKVSIQQMFSGGMITDCTIFCCLFFLRHLMVQLLHKCHGPKPPCFSH